MPAIDQGLAPDAAAAAPHKPVKILLVDDGKDNLFSLQAALEPLGEEILTASSGKEALRLCLIHEFAVILLDVRMPDMDGFETAEFIRSRKRSKHTPLLFVTAYRSDEQLFRGYDLGAVDFLFRPLVPEILQSKVRVFVELSRTTELLRESEQGLRQLAGSLPQLVWTAAPDGQCDYLGPQWLAYTGLPEAPQLGCGWLEQVHPDDREIAVLAWNAAQLGALNLDVEFRIRRHDGAYRWFKTRAVPLKDEQNQIVKWFGTNTDIEEAKVAEEQLRESKQKLDELNADLERRIGERTAELEASNKELEAFAYSVAHDLRGPLRAMDGFSDLLLTEYAGKVDEKGRHYLERIQVASRRMAQLISDLLHLAQLTRRQLLRERVDLSSVARAILADLQAQDPARRADLHIAGGLLVEGDPNLLRVALENLLGNAWKFTRNVETACIEMGALNRESEHVFFVRDNGVGFDMAYTDRLFVAFQRLHRTEEFPGTGVGLATVQRIVARHGGRIWPEAAVNRGATFYFTLGKQS